MQEDTDNLHKILLPHHEQQTLCTTRLAYRQGRKLTAVKVYSISSESNHLLIFGVPSLNLRQETKSLFIKFGKLLQFNISKEHASDTFTETYHAQYEKIQSARHAKRMVDTKNFYGGSLHVCYAPELESVVETRQKLVRRHQDVIYRLKNLQKEKNIAPQIPIISNTVQAKSVKLNMGEVNIITVKRPEVRKKRKFVTKNFQADGKNKSIRNTIVSEGITECNVTVNNARFNVTNSDGNVTIDTNSNIQQTGAVVDEKVTNVTIEDYSQNVEIVDCSGVDNEVITNINESLNYNTFGNEIIKKITLKPTNKIQFHFNKKS